MVKVILAEAQTALVFKGEQTNLANAKITQVRTFYNKRELTIDNKDEPGDMLLRVAGRA